MHAQYDLMAFFQIEKLMRHTRHNTEFSNHNDWYHQSIFALYGVLERFNMSILHYKELHKWGGWQTGYKNLEYHLSIILFGMDSTIECMVFMANALGNGAFPEMFLDVSSPVELKKVSPKNILNPNKIHRKDISNSYRTKYVNFTKYWEANQDLFNVIAENHDVSKHRMTIRKPCTMKSNPPEGFLEANGLTPNDFIMRDFAPVDTVAIDNETDAKLPQALKSMEYDEAFELENVFPKFSEFISICGKHLLQDITAIFNEKLNQTSE